MHKPIFLKDLSLSFTNKNCFEDFSAHIYPGNRIAIIGRNGSGKSSLLNIIRGTLSPSAGEVIGSSDVCMSYVEQTITDLNSLSGGQRLNQRLSQALAQFPDVLLLDEPTNHLDKNNRKSLMRMLQRFQGTLIIASHDTELLTNCIDTLWHIDNNKIHVFTGAYQDYMHEIKQKRAAVESEIALLQRDKKDIHMALMKEQQRAAKSRTKGKKSIDERKWPTIVSKSKALRAEQTSGKKKVAIDKKKKQLTEQLEDLRLPEVIVPTFSLTAENINLGNVLTITEADVGYVKEQPVLKNINVVLSGKERVAIAGQNASGKSTLLKAIVGKDKLIRTGDWHLPKTRDIGYLDQHYANLNPDLSIIDLVKDLRRDWSDAEARRHLNDFLFKSNEDVVQLVANLSGGEKARVCLSLIAAKTPKLLILDEITNNLDLETKAHVIQVLKHYPGALIVVSHEDDFLQAIGVDRVCTVVDRGIRG